MMTFETTMLLQASTTARMSALDQVEVLRLQRADVDDHVDFLRAVGDGALRLEGLDLGAVGPEREADDRADLDVRHPEHLRAERHVGRVDADRGETEAPRFLAERLDLVARGVRA